MKKNKIIATLLLATAIITQPVTVSYAATSYSKDQVSQLGTWELQADNTSYKFKTSKGTYLTNTWLESMTEQGIWYYVDEDGLMLTNTTTPDNYYVDAEGKWRDSIDSSLSDTATDAADETQASETTTSVSTNEPVTYEQIKTMTYDEIKQLTAEQIPRDLSFEQIQALSERQKAAMIEVWEPGVHVIDPTTVTVDMEGAAELTESMRNAMSK